MTYTVWHPTSDRYVIIDGNDQLHDVVKTAQGRYVVSSSSYAEYDTLISVVNQYNADHVPGANPTSALVSI